MQSTADINKASNTDMPWMYRSTWFDVASAIRCHNIEAAEIAARSQYTARYRTGAAERRVQRATWRASAANHAKGPIRDETNRTVSPGLREEDAAPQHQVAARARLATPRTF